MPQQMSESFTSQPIDVASGERFAFGRNWQKFLRSLTEDRILQADKSIRELLETENFDQKTFLDVGSGSGLFSLAARRLGASVFSFDYDQESVACTARLKDAFFPDDNNWRIECGSALDKEFLRAAGTFDVVYSWGVLHHTGAMWKALENMTHLVKKGGSLVIAIYNDQGRKSDMWRFIKRKYNQTPARLRFLILCPIGASLLLAMTVADLCRLHKPRIIADHSGSRGMSIWTDIVDWVGGYPFEVASRSEIIDFYEQRGFRLEKMVSCGRKLGCNQFVLKAVEAWPQDETPTILR